MLGQINLYLGVQGLGNHKLISKELLKQALHTSEKWIRIKNLTWNTEKCDVEQTAKVTVKSKYQWCTCKADAMVKPRVLNTFHKFYLFF